MALTPPGFYVYQLVDPRDEGVFYVGKGSGDRLHVHERQAGRRYSGQNPRKDARILEIRGAGLRVRAEVIKDSLTEAEAFDLERDTIEAIGPERLANHVRGVQTLRERARLMLSRLKPFDVWAAEEPRSPLAIDCYRVVAEQLVAIAGGSLDHLPPGVAFER